MANSYYLRCRCYSGQMCQLVEEVAFIDHIPEADDMHLAWIQV